MLSVTEPTASPPLPAAFNLAAHVLAQADALADKMAMQIVRPTGAERWSYGRLQAAVRGAGTGLLARGLAPGDRVLVTSFGSGAGSDAFALRVTDAILERRGKALSTAAYIARRTEIDYGTYVRFRGKLAMR